MRAYHHGSINSGRDLRETIRAGAYAWPGGYPLYFITSDGAALAFDTVRKEFKCIVDAIRRKHSNGWRVVACDINWEDAELFDAHTGKRIESAYA